MALLLLSSGNPAGASSITLYTSQSEEDARRTVGVFEEIHPGFKVNWQRSGASEMLARLQTEHRQGKPSADVVQFADMLTMEALKADHLLARYRDAPVGDIPPLFLDSDFRYFGSKTMNTGIAYRTDGEIVPASWNDLLLPAVRDKVVLPNPVYAGTASVFLASMKAAPGFGLEYFDRLKGNRATIVPGNGDVLAALVSGRKSYGVILDYMPLRAALQGAPLRFVFPKEGVSTVNQPVAIIASTKNPEGAKAFVDFILSPEGRRLVREQGFYSVNPADPPPPGFPSLAGANFLPVDPLDALYESTHDNIAFANLFAQ